MTQMDEDEGEQWKIGFQKALANYFYAQKFFVWDENYYGQGQDYEATREMRAHLDKEFCAVDRAESDSTLEFRDEEHSFFTDTDADSITKTFVIAHMTCRCRKYRRLPVALEDSLSNAIKWVTR